LAGRAHATDKDPGESAGRSIGRWLARIFHRLRAGLRDLETRQRDAYLAQAQNLSDLEARMRHLDGDALSRSRALG
jgi:hypothetical protein